MNPWQRANLAEAQSELLRKLCDEKDKRIALLEKQNEELKALFNKTSQFEVVEQGEDRVTLKMKPVNTTQGRAGFRGQREAREARTHSVPADSAAALEKRVAEGAV